MKQKALIFPQYCTIDERTLSMYLGDRQEKRLIRRWLIECRMMFCLHKWALIGSLLVYTHFTIQIINSRLLDVFCACSFGMPLYN